MKHLMVLVIALLVPTSVMAKGECDEDKQKLCKEAIEAQGDVGACLDQHMAELLLPCGSRA